MSRGQSGGVLLYAVLSLLVLGSISFGFQRLLVPTATSGLDTLELARANAAEDAVKSILRQQLGKNSDGKKLYALLQTLHGKTLTLGDGTSIVLTFTPYWFRSGTVESKSLPQNDLPFPPPGVAGKHDMIAVYTGPGGKSVTRFSYDFGTREASISIPANADVYFLLQRKYVTPFARNSLYYNDSEKKPQLVLQNALISRWSEDDVRDFTQVLPVRDALIGLIGEDGAVDGVKDVHGYSFVYGGWETVEGVTPLMFNTVGCVFGKSTLSALQSSAEASKRQYNLALGQHVRVDMAITLPSGAALTRVWRFNGGKSLEASGRPADEAFNLAAPLLEGITKLFPNTDKPGALKFTVDSTAPGGEGSRLAKLLAYFKEQGLDLAASGVLSWTYVGINNTTSYLYWSEVDIGARNADGSYVYPPGTIILVMRYRYNYTHVGSGATPRADTYTVGWLPVREKTTDPKGEAYLYIDGPDSTWSKEQAGYGEDRTVNSLDEPLGHWQTKGGMSEEQKESYAEAAAYYAAVKAKREKNGKKPLIKADATD